MFCSSQQGIHRRAYYNNKVENNKIVIHAIEKI